MPTRTCRTCLKVLHKKTQFLTMDNTNHSAVKKNIKTKLQAFIPELNLGCVKDAVMCNDCVDALFIADDFKKKCLESETKLTEYMKRTEVDEIDLDTAVHEISGSVEKTPTQKSNSIRCLVCNKGFSAEEFKDHMNTHMSPLKCTHCRYETNSQLHLDRHLKTHQTPYVTHEAKLLKCTQCDFKTTKNVNYRRHMKTHNGKGTMQCGHCNFTTDSALNYQMHVKTHEDVSTCKFCDYTSFSPINLRRHILRTHRNEKGQLDNDSFNLSMGDIAFIMDSDNVNEIIEDLGESPKDTETYLISDADLIEALKDTNAKSYLKENNNRPSAFHCPVCKMSFKFRYMLNKHLNQHNDGNQPFKCDECGFSSDKKGSFKLHMTIHTGGKVYACESCDFRTLYYNNYMKHVENHKKLAETCGNCDFKTNDYDEMSRHLLTHAKFRCAECTFETNEEESMQVHLDMHAISNAFIDNSLHQHFLQPELVN